MKLSDTKKVIKLAERAAFFAEKARLHADKAVILMLDLKDEVKKEVKRGRKSKKK
jgi:hypothetical protein